MSFDPNDPAIQAVIAAAVAQAIANLQAQIPTPQPQTTFPVPSTTDNPATRPLPAINQITLLQATFFDNWPNGVPVKHTNRFKITLEVWNDDPEDIRLSKWYAKSSVNLYEYWQFGDKLKTWLARKTIPQEFHDQMYNTWECAERPMNSPDSIWFGILGNKGDKNGDGKKGTVYYDRQYVLVSMLNNKPEWAIVFVGDASLDIVAFSATDMKGNPLKGNAKYQARIDLSNYSDEWKTN
jgi:hypothetical protein